MQNRSWLVCCHGNEMEIWSVLACPYGLKCMSQLLERSLVKLLHVHLLTMWEFIWLNTKSECGTRPFYGRESCIDRNLCAARPKKASSLWYSVIWALQMSSHALSLAWRDGPLKLSRHDETLYTTPRGHARKDGIWRPSEAESLQRKSALVVRVSFHRKHE